MARKFPDCIGAAELLRIYNVKALKRLSQNFLLDSKITDHIARFIHHPLHLAASSAKDASALPPDSGSQFVESPTGDSNKPQDSPGQHAQPRKIVILEVGPGPGTLTRSILRSLTSRRNPVSPDVLLLAVEKDRRFEPLLQQLSESYDGKLAVLFRDALKFDYDSLVSESSCSLVGALPQGSDGPSASHFSSAFSTPPPRYSKQLDLVQIVGNLPFNVATPLYLKFLKAMTLPNTIFSHPPVASGLSAAPDGIFSKECSLYLLFQREVADRIIARVGSPAYSRLSIMSQYIADIKFLSNIDASCFTPRPLVDTTLLKISRKAEPLPGMAAGNHVTFDQLEYATSYMFAKRRKMVENICKGVDWDYLGINPRFRPEDLSVTQYCLLTEYLRTRKKIDFGIAAAETNYEKLLKDWKQLRPDVDSVIQKRLHAGKPLQMAPSESPPKLIKQLTRD